MKSLLSITLLLSQPKKNILFNHNTNNNYNNLNRFILLYNKYFYSTKTTPLFAPLTQEKLKQIKTDNETTVDELIKDYKTKNILFYQNDKLNNRAKINDDAGIKNFSLDDKLNDSNKLKTQKNNNLDPNKKPSLEQLNNVKRVMTQIIPEFLFKKHMYEMYTVDIVFENCFYDQPKMTHHARLGILKITNDEQEGTVKIRWRLTGVRGSKSFFQPWKIKAWKARDSADTQAEWIDGFSILYVRGDGLIYKHRVQRVMTQKDEQGVLAKNEKITQKNLNVNPTIYQNNNMK